MQTSCPYCETLFNVDDELVQALDARVRCGQCRTIFNARDRLLAKSVIGDESPETESYIQETPSLQVEARPPRFDGQSVNEQYLKVSPDGSDDEPENPPVAEVQRNIFEDVGTNWDEPSEDPESEEDAFELFKQPKPVSAGKTVWWLLGSLLLLAAGAGQWVYAYRATIVASPQIRPALLLACGYLDCELDPLRAVGQINILRRSVYSHPNIDNALIISLAMINNADYAQPFPILAIRMANVRGQFVAQRHFEPENYLDAPTASGMMSPGAPVTVTLEIQDPGKDALTFELDFL
jgi:predicted Zn finger-like uncharacterized protein